MPDVEFFEYEDQRLAYSEYGSGPRVVVLLHGLLLSQAMHEPLAKDLAARGNRVITVDLLGHGRSDRPRDMWRYSMSLFGQQTIALLDHLELDEAVVMGTSLGANTALMAAAHAPERLRGMVIEMPVLDNALLACAVVFAPLLVALTFGEPAMRVVQRLTKAVPRRVLPFWGNVALDTVRQDPGPGAAVLQGLFFGEVAPHRSVRRELKVRALVLGHRRDPVHPFSDAGMLATELENSRLIEADSLVELRLKPERLTNEIAQFIEECWVPPAQAARSRPRASAARAGGSGRSGATRAAAGSRRAAAGSRRARAAS